MPGCLLIGAKALTLASATFTLSWTHSVEKTGWRESWRIEAGALALDEAAVQGSGAGMEPGEDAVLRDGWWVWRPSLPPQPFLTLARSGATGGGWRICDAAGACVTLPETGEPDLLRPCPAPAGD